MASIDKLDPSKTAVVFIEFQARAGAWPMRTRLSAGVTARARHVRNLFGDPRLAADSPLAWPHVPPE